MNSFGPSFSSPVLSTKPCRQCLLRPPPSHHPLPSRDFSSGSIPPRTLLPCTHLPPPTPLAAPTAPRNPVPGSALVQAVQAAKCSARRLPSSQCPHHTLRTPDFTAQTYSRVHVCAALILQWFSRAGPGLTQFASPSLYQPLAGTWVVTWYGPNHSPPGDHTLHLEMSWIWQLTFC